jgi:hypothetical protein
MRERAVAPGGSSVSNAGPDLAIILVTSRSDVHRGLKLFDDVRDPNSDTSGLISSNGVAINMECAQPGSSTGMTVRYSIVVMESRRVTRATPRWPPDIPRPPTQGPPITRTF